MIATWAKWDFEIWHFLWFLEAKIVNLGSIDFHFGLPLISIEMMGKAKLKSMSQNDVANFGPIKDRTILNYE